MISGATPRSVVVRALGILFVAFAIIGVGMTHAACGDDPKEFFNVVYEAGSDGDDASADGAGEIDPTLGGPCTDDTQCVDTVALADGGSVPIDCTFDRCDKTINRCRHVPDDSLCDDKEYCNGKELCVPKKGCSPGPVVTCQDDNTCSIDRCVEETKSCEHKERDSDGDGDPDDHCVPKKDCDDTDPTVSSTKVEICGNFKDDNCNGIVDEPGCVSPQNDTCATALEITEAKTYLLTTVAAKRDYGTTCSVKNDAASKDIVVKITVPPGDAKNVLVTASTSNPPNEVAVAMRTGACEAGDTGTPVEESCGAIEQATRARAIAREVPAGSSVWAIVKTQFESAVDLKVELLPSEKKPTNETCGQAIPVPVDGAGEPLPQIVWRLDPAKDLASGCDKAKTGELVYSFTLAAERDVKIFASTLTGTGQPVVSLRTPGACTTELRCRSGSTPPLFARRLPAGTHQFSVAGTGQIDASILVKTYPPTDPPKNQTCADPPILAHNTPLIVNLADQEDAIKNSCGTGGPNAAYRLELLQESDVLVIGRFPQNEAGSIAVHGPAGPLPDGGAAPPLCSTSDRLGCFTGSSPVRMSLRKLPAGSYRIVIADELGQNVELTALVRPYSPAVAVTSEGCADALTIPATGGFFTGDTSTRAGDFNAGCDAPGLPIGGAKDQLLKLDLATSKRVVFDMSGSVYTTLLDIRQGTACPGIEVPSACHVGFGPNRSFLDTTLGPGTYWVQVDGYALDSGIWNLDVRVLP